MGVDYFDGWGKNRAIELVEAWPGTAPRPALRGPRKGGHLKYSASYEIDGTEPRHIAVALRGTNRGVHLYINELSTDGRRYSESDFATIEVLDRKAAGFEGKDGNPGIGTGVNRNASLKPKQNDLLSLYVRDEQSFVALLGWYSGRAGGGATEVVSSPPPVAIEYSGEGTEPAERSSPVDRTRSLSLEDLLRRLGENAETGSLGELAALAAERARIEAAGCTDPTRHVVHVAVKNVSAGFDIESAWNGETRFIEVKSTRGESGDFFISENERATLAKLGAKAWLYRVQVNGDGFGTVVEMINDPIQALGAASFEPVAWRVRRPGTP